MKVAIVGVGLLGGSIGYILKEKKWATKVLGVGRNISRLEKAVSLNAIDEYIVEVGEKIKEYDIVILCTPVVNIPDFAKKIIPFLKTGAILTDIGSTKSYITNKIEEILPDDIYFVGGHPMAGSEKTGVEALDPYIFENAVYVITKGKKSSQDAINTIKSMIKVLDANVIEMDADIHDEAVATISHLPHVVAAALVNSAGEIDSSNKFALSLAAGGFRDTTRIASGSPEMWRDICLTNKKMIIKLIDILAENTNKFKEAIENSNGEEIQNLFEKAKLIRDQIPSKKKGIMSPMLEFLVYVPDKPGVIGEIANLLGKNNINIKDIEVVHVRENEGGSIRIGVSTEHDMAISILEQNGFNVKKRD